MSRSGLGRPVGGGPPGGETSPLFEQHRDSLRAAAGLGAILDLACGRGRHALALAKLGIPCIALDRNAGFLAELGERAGDDAKLIYRLRSDVEAGHGIPVKSGSCGAILVFRFLFRPLAPAIEKALAPGGWLLYETFTVDQLRLEGGPRRTEFLLEHGELPKLFPGLEIVSYEETIEHAPSPRAVARLAARRPR
jgi:SAM-dependent methyltransferase